MKRTGPRLTRYTSPVLFSLANSASKRTANEPLEALAAIILSAIAVEAFFNDLVDFMGSFAGGKEPPQLQEAASVCDELEADNASLITKMRVTHRILKHTPLPIGRPPIQDFGLLMKLRNKLVHKRPETSPFPLTTPEPEHTRLVQGLVSRGLIKQPYLRDIAYPSSYLATPAVANWAYETAKKTARFLIQMLPASNTKDALNHSFWPKLDGAPP